MGGNELVSNFIKICKDCVVVQENIEKGKDLDSLMIDENNVFVVWACKTLQNRKAILSATNKGAYFYEFTQNGDKNEIYMDVYKKEKHYVIEGE